MESDTYEFGDDGTVAQIILERRRRPNQSYVHCSIAYNTMFSFYFHVEIDVDAIWLMQV